MSTSGERIRVVVADDVAEMRDGLSDVIRQDARLELVGVARDGTEAAAVALALRPDVVVMDLRMGGLDGITAAHRVTAALPRTAVVMYTAYDDPSLADDARHAGVAAYVTKGTSARELLTTIRGCYEARRHLPRTAEEADLALSLGPEPADGPDALAHQAGHRPAP